MRRDAGRRRDDVAGACQPPLTAKQAHEEQRRGDRGQRHQAVPSYRSRGECEQRIRREHRPGADTGQHTPGATRPARDERDRDGRKQDGERAQRRRPVQARGIHEVVDKRKQRMVVEDVLATKRI